MEVPIVATVSNLSEAVEQFRGASSSARQATFRELVARIRQTIREDGTAEAAEALRRTIAPSLDYTSFQTLDRLYQSLPAGALAAKKKVAFLAGCTTTAKLATSVKLAVFWMGGVIETFETDYGVYRQELLDPNSTLYEWRPDTIFLATGWRDLVHRPKLSSGYDEVARLVGAEYGEWSALWRTAHERTGCQIIQNNFDRPAWRQLDNHESRHPAAWAASSVW